MRRLAAASVVLSLTVGISSPAWAGGESAGAAADQTNGTTQADAAVNNGAPPGKGPNPRPKSGPKYSGPPPQCTGKRYGDLSPKPIGGGSGDVRYVLASPDIQALEESYSPHAPGTGAWYEKWCGPGDNYFAGVVWLSNGSGARPGQPQVDPAQLAQDAEDIAQLPTPSIGMNPPADQLVQLTTWLWIDSAQWKPVTASATAGPVTSTVTATPYQVDWDMGNGDHKICDNPGIPYAPNATPTCAYTYRQSSAGKPGDAFQVTATTTWRVNWTATGAPGGGDLGILSRTSAPVAVRVAENQAINNG